MMINPFWPLIGQAHGLGYLVIFLNFTLETITLFGFFLPGTSAMILVGFLCSQGYLAITPAFITAMAGCFFGTGLNYHFGRKGSGLFRPGRRWLAPAALTQGQVFFHRHGDKSLVLGSFIPYLRSVITLIAGMFKMPTKKFWFYNIFSVVCWVATFGLLGYFFGQAWELIATWSTRAGLFFLVILLLVIGFFFTRRYFFQWGRTIGGLARSLGHSVWPAIQTNQEVQKIVRQHPKVFAWLGRRLRNDHFSGWPLTIFMLAGIYLLSLFIGLVESIIRSQPIVAVDLRLENLFIAFRDPALVKFFFWLTLLGKWPVVLASVGVAALLIWLWPKRQYLLGLLVSIIGSQSLTSLAKVIISRERPQSGLYLEASRSFPSGHAVLAVVFFGFLIYILWRELKGWKKKINILFAGLSLIILIGFSRLYLGVHYLSDVWGGYILGLLWLLAGISLVEWQRHRHRFESKPRAPIKLSLKFLMVMLLLAWAVGYLAVINYSPPPTLPVLPPSTSQAVGGEVATIFDQYHFSRYTEKLTGARQEPLSFIILAQDDQSLVQAFYRAGWQLADGISFKSTLKIIQAAVANENYLTAPMTPSFWQGRVHDFGLEKPTAAESVRQRHHARFWRTNLVTPGGLQIYVGTVSLDIGLKWGVVHRIKPDIDTDREVLFTDLRQTGAVKNFSLEQSVEPILGQNFTGDSFFTDGKIYLAELEQ